MEICPVPADPVYHQVLNKCDMFITYFLRILICSLIHTLQEDPMGSTGWEWGWGVEGGRKYIRYSGAGIGISFMMGTYKYVMDPKAVVTDLG